MDFPWPNVPFPSTVPPPRSFRGSPKTHPVMLPTDLSLSWDPQCCIRILFAPMKSHNNVDQGVIPIGGAISSYIRSILSWIKRYFENMLIALILVWHFLHDPRQNQFFDGVNNGTALCKISPNWKREVWRFPTQQLSNPATHLCWNCCWYCYWMDEFQCPSSHTCYSIKLN